MIIKQYTFICHPCMSPTNLINSYNFILKRVFLISMPHRIYYKHERFNVYAHISLLFHVRIKISKLMYV